MNGQPTVADVFRAGQAAFLGEYGARLSPEQRRVLRDIQACRTAALGGHVEQCDGCGHRRAHYNSCRNRHCPQCQAGARAAWLEARQTELLPIPYFHVVFTLPGQLGPLALQNPRLMYDLLFRAAAETLLEVAADPKHLGARIGVLMVLHTWGQNLMHHPHVHCVATGGGLSADGAQWIPVRRSPRSGREFFLPVRVLSRVFRGKFIAGLKRAFAAGRLAFHGRLAAQAQPANFEQLLNAAVKKDWVVYAKRPFGGPQQVLKYLARYTHRVAISHARIKALRDGQVTFQYKDYADRSRTKEMTLATSEFMRRFLLHTLPNGFVRIRYYGLLSNRQRLARLAHCRLLLGVPGASAESLPAERPTDPARSEPERPHERCPVCHQGRMIVVETLHAAHVRKSPPPHFQLGAARGANLLRQSAASNAPSSKQDTS